MALFVCCKAGFQNGPVGLDGGKLFDKCIGGKLDREADGTPHNQERGQRGLLWGLFAADEV